MSKKHKRLVQSLHKESILKSIATAFIRLTPWYLLNNPAIFITYIGSILTFILYFISFSIPELGSPPFILHVSLWLWFTVIFSNFAESIAECRGKAQANSLKKTRQETQAKKIKNNEDRKYILIPATDLNYHDIVLVEANDVIPADGLVIDGVAAVDESAITGESAPVIRERSEERNSVTGGTMVLSDWLVVRITSKPGETFLDKMISLVEGAKRQRSPNEIALCILLAGMTLIFLIVIMTLLPFSFFSVQNYGGTVVNLTTLIALLICLIPTTIGGLLSAIGIAGMDRLICNNVIATSGRAVEAAGDVNILLLDKTGTITIGNRQAIAFFPAPEITIEEMSKACELSSLSDETPEGKSIVQLARVKYFNPPTDINTVDAIIIPFCAETRISGIRFNQTEILKGAFDRIARHVQDHHNPIDENIIKRVEDIARAGGTPLVVAQNAKILGVIELKDIIKKGIKERLAELRAMGIQSIMITGDNPLTAATIANEAGVDDFRAEATPEMKLKLIRELQENGQMVAMVGDGTNDAPALAQTDVAIAMNTGTQAAKEASNMVDLDSDPTKIIEIVKIGKQLLITRGALTTFSISNDIAKYFAIIPAAFSDSIPQLSIFNIMHLQTPTSAILSAVIFNALSIICLIPLALKGIPYKTANADTLLKHNIITYGLGGVIIPFIGIKCIDMILGHLPL